MQIGVGLPNTITGLVGETLIDWMRQADRGPFSCVATLDRVAYDSYDPLVTLSAGAAITSQIGLATMIVIGPLRNTTILGKTASSLNVLSGGRFTLGLSVGARSDDYEITGVPYNERGTRFDQQLADLRDQWDSAVVGPYLAPKLLVGGLADITFGRVARYANGYMHNGGPPPIFNRMADKARTAWAETGRPGKPELWGMGYYALGSEEVISTGRDYLLDYYAFTGPFAERIAQGLLTTPQAIMQFARGYSDAGCDNLILFPTAQSIEQLHRLTDAVG